MRTILVLFVFPAALGALAGWLVRRLCRKLGLSRGWLFFAASFCYATLDTGAVWYAGAGSAADGWADLGALITGAMLVSFSLAGLAVAGVRRSSLAPWAPPSGMHRAILRGVVGYGLGTLLLSPAILLLGRALGVSASSAQSGLLLTVYLILLVLAYPLVGFLLGRWLAGGIAALWGVLCWVALLIPLGLLAVGPGARDAAHMLYARLNFPMAVFLEAPFHPSLTPGTGWILSLSAAPPILFCVGWLASLLRSQKHS